VFRADYQRRDEADSTLSEIMIISGVMYLQ